MGKRAHLIHLSVAFIVGGHLLAPVGKAASLKVSVASGQRTGSEVEADYGLAHVFVNELRNDRIPITVFFSPDATNVVQAEVFTNLDRRDLATIAPNGIEEGGGLKSEVQHRFV